MDARTPPNSHCFHCCRGLCRFTSALARKTGTARLAPAALNSTESFLRGATALFSTVEGRYRKAQPRASGTCDELSETL